MDLRIGGFQEENKRDLTQEIADRKQLQTDFTQSQTNITYSHKFSNGHLNDNFSINKIGKIAFLSSYDKRQAKEEVRDRVMNADANDRQLVRFTWS